MVTYGRFLSERLRPCSTHQVEASGRNPRGGDRHGTNHTSSRALCVELSEQLTSSIPIGDGSQSGMGRAASKGPASAVNEATMYSYNTNKRRSSSENPIPGTREKCELVKNLHTSDRSFLELIAAAATAAAAAAIT